MDRVHPKARYVRYIYWPPKGYIDLVKREPSLSMAHVEDEEITDINWHALLDVNDGVNWTTKWSYDIPGQDVWGVFRKVGRFNLGDCDDFAVAKLEELLKLGWPRSCLRLAVCRVGPTRTWHCVLLVYAGGECIILDNIDHGLWFKKLKTEYEWVAEEWPGHNTWWRTFDGQN